jgi:hypothetical protein
MEWKLFATVFASIFIAELADKTQMVTLLFAADKAVNKWIVFWDRFRLVWPAPLGAAGAHPVAVINMKLMTIIAGSGFILIGAWTCTAVCSRQFFRWIAAPAPAPPYTAHKRAFAVGVTELLFVVVEGVFGVWSSLWRCSRCRPQPERGWVAWPGGACLARRQPPPAGPTGDAGDDLASVR